ncbi:predicted protein [Nematostella vectensis]|uniref:Bleomycin hydrolase n=1 Tax=Nematostella vectensis TaxID=45351 RepID=A7RM23_NEMVE|nr:predicted protein [Nematostella vectensis]|eukprot:XP_001639588.1 predicted protein [Nematostella vectensis]
MADEKKEVGVSLKQLALMQTAFNSDPKNSLAQNFASNHDVLDLCIDRKVVEKTNHVFTHKVKEVKPMTNQKSSGRCWIFALLNVIRQKFVQEKNLDEFEFSQQYLFFWDKIERSYFFINAFLDLAKKGEKPDSRLFMFLLSNPMNDGGQWDMLVNLIEKYGIMPKAAWPESVNSGKTRRMNVILNHKHREFAMKFGKMVAAGASEVELQTTKNNMMAEIYRIVSICIGSPPANFTWEYYDKDKNFFKLEDITPLQFYTEHVKPLYNIKDKVCFVNDPRNPYDKMYTVEYLGNVTNGGLVRYNNQPIEVLKYLAAASLRANEPVWFGCDVGKHFERKFSALDLNIHNYKLAFGLSMLKLNKTERLLYGDSLMTHAMALTGLSYEVITLPEHHREAELKWRVENSWGDDKPEKGYLLMTDEWFSEFVFEVVVDKKFVPADILAILVQEPVVLPAWDPMGALACGNCCKELVGGSSL